MTWFQICNYNAFMTKHKRNPLDPRAPLKPIGKEVREFLLKSGMSLADFGRETVGTKALVTRLMSGKDVTSTNADKIRAFIKSQMKEVA